jgi:membrane-bound metal-dependent hydrolase YbcI (DUF457 family)
VGHFAFGYISSKTSAKLLKTQLNIPLVLMLSVIPDIDILMPFLQHRGPTHSILVAFMVFIPIFAIYHRAAVPYFVALIQHSLVGDYIAGGRIQLFWPVTTQYYGTSISIRSPVNITIEWVMFFVSMVIMFKAGDLEALIKPKNSNLILMIPLFTVLLPTFLAFPIEVPLVLILPHIAYLILFSASILACVGRRK